MKPSKTKKRPAKRGDGGNPMIDKLLVLKYRINDAFRDGGPYFLLSCNVRYRYEPSQNGGIVGGSNGVAALLWRGGINTFVSGQNGVFLPDFAPWLVSFLPNGGVCGRGMGAVWGSFDPLEASKSIFSHRGSILDGFQKIDFLTIFDPI